MPNGVMQTEQLSNNSKNSKRWRGGGSGRSHASKRELGHGNDARSSSKMATLSNTAIQLDLAPRRTTKSPSKISYLITLLIFFVVFI